MDNSKETPSIADVPRGWTRTKRPPINCGGYVWRSYRTGIGAYALIAEALGSNVVRRNYERTTYSATATGMNIGNRFRTETAAMEALAKRIDYDTATSANR